MEHESTPSGNAYHLRGRILAVLDTARTLNEIASATNATDARVLWHLEQMRDEGVVVHDDSDDAWQRGNQPLIDHIPASEETAWLARVRADFDDGMAECAEGLYGADQVQASGEHRTRLSVEQAMEFEERLRQLVDEYFAPGRGDRTGVKYGFHWVLTPIDLHPLDEPTPDRQ